MSVQWGRTAYTSRRIDTLKQKCVVAAPAFLCGCCISFPIHILSVANMDNLRFVYSSDCCGLNWRETVQHFMWLRWVQVMEYLGRPGTNFSTFDFGERKLTRPE